MRSNQILNTKTPNVIKNTEITVFCLIDSDRYILENMTTRGMLNALTAYTTLRSNPCKA